VTAFGIRCPWVYKFQALGKLAQGKGWDAAGGTVLAGTAYFCIHKTDFGTIFVISVGFLFHIYQ
jgi:hypothetical protein